MRKDATPETLCPVLPALLRRRRKQMQLRKNATPQWPISSSPTACHNTSLPVSLKSGYLKNICSMVNSVAVRRIGREATKWPLVLKGFVPTISATKEEFVNRNANSTLKWMHMYVKFHHSSHNGTLEHTGVWQAQAETFHFGSLLLQVSTL